MPRSTDASPDPVLSFETADDWAAWLRKQPSSASAVWLKIAKKGAGAPSPTYDEALDAALCFGWIDGQKKSVDDTHWLQRFSPRRAGSKWSKVNRQKAEILIERGRMSESGLREVEAAKADGRWEAAYAGQSKATVPEDLQAALDADDEARAFFATLNSRNRYAILYRIQDAKKPDTRARRIEKFVTMLREHRTLHWPGGSRTAQGAPAIPRAHRKRGMTRQRTPVPAESSPAGREWRLRSPPREARTPLPWPAPASRSGLPYGVRRDPAPQVAAARPNRIRSYVTVAPMPRGWNRMAPTHT